MSRDPECVFCKIVAGVFPSHVVHEDDAAFAFLDISPVAPGHLLIVPKDHYAALADMPPQTVGAIAGLLPRLGRAAMSVTQAEGFNVLVNNGVVAGQVVEHVHFHLIPRRKDDGLGYRWAAGKYGEGEAERLLRSYHQALPSRSDSPT